MDHFDQTTTTMHYKFQCHQSFWTQYCAIINFNPALLMEKVHETLDGRLILAKFTLIDNSIQPFYVLNLYAPAEHSSRSKTMFFSNMISMIHSLPNSAAILPSLIVAGDFNYSFDSSGSHYTVEHPCTSLIDFAQHNLHDCFNVPGESFYDFTFTRGTSRSTIDYVFAGVNIYPHINDTHVEFMARSWTDHALLSFAYTVGSFTVGKGTWRANPTLATNPVYVTKLNQELDSYVQHKLLDSSPVQDQWDHIKRLVKKVTQNFCLFRAAKQQKLLRDLQSDRNRLLRNHRNDSVVLQSLLPDLDSQIAKIQKTRAKTYRLRASKRWLEHNEKLAGYLACIATVRNSSRNFQMIIHPVSGVPCEDTESKLDAIHTFYTDLYTKKDIDMNCLETMLGFVQRQLGSADAQSIIAAITMDDLLEGAQRCPSKSSPGLDGLPYEILHLILSNPHCHSIALKVYNEAITLARFPLSWQQACIALIPKKGDLADLANWRPISLINTDCKVFTRLLNARIVPLASSLITEYQAGFMRDRFIGDHGLTNKLILEDAQKTTDTGLEFVGVMLDQTKAYDRIHPRYLAKVLEKFEFPPAFVACIQNLFFNNQIFVNMNGFLSPAVSQQRGLRQGDSISPMLFNFAIEPFLQSILVNPNIRGYSLQHGDTALTNDLHYVSPHRPVKLLAYADDVLLYVHSIAEFHVLQHCLATYNKASNSLINYNKSVAFPLSGLSLSSPQGAQLQEFIVHNQRMRWYDASSTGHLPYLGFPIWFTIRQREAFTSSMLQKIASAFEPHRQRNLSMYGRATIANVLVLTKLWHILRITPLPKAFFHQVQSLVHQFLYGKMFPRMRSSIFYLPRHRGDLGILNAAVQQQVFQFRYLKALLNDNLSRATTVPPFLVQLLSDSLQVTYGAPNATFPLLFQGWRQPRHPQILFSFLPLLFQAMDACFPSRDHASIWPQIPPASACLSPPFVKYSIATPIIRIPHSSFRNICPH
ncbi:uncharacterized protein ATC70_006890 [Mucor velutinosus]|uniref:Reverse transcriptase domain-containing protein n=1 Tax=Mucor velutinosus TaxID=708070 RepID=A0AAN7DSU3_9FUNG|nr:hypothetical protein ATC70_006890 [Mucor velutinosus]